MSGKKVLLVEGPDDEHVVKAFLGHRELVWLEEIKAYRGKTQLLEALPVRLKQSDIAALGVLIDADTDLESCWQAVRQRLIQAGYSEWPSQPDPEGTIASGPPGTLLPRVGVWLMPDNRTPGILEDFLRLLVPVAGQGLLKHAELAIETIPLGERRFVDPKRSKALIHTWLAWQEEPGRPLGQAITARFLDSSAQEAELFANWLLRLFADQEDAETKTPERRTGHE